VTVWEISEYIIAYCVYAIQRTACVIITSIVPGLLNADIIVLGGPKKASHY